MTLRLRLLLTSLAVALPLAGGLFLIQQREKLADMRERLGQFAQAELASDVLARCQARGGLIGRPPRPAGDPSAVADPPPEREPPPPVRADGPPPIGSDGPPPEGPDGQPRPSPGGSQNDPLGRGRGRRGAPPPRDGRPNGPRPGEQGGNGPGREGRRPPPPPPRQQAAQSPYDVFSYSADGQSVGPNAPTMSAQMLAGLSTGDAPTETYASDEGTGLRMAVWMSRDAGSCSILLLQMRPRRGEQRDQLVALLLVTFSAMVAAWIAAGPVISRMRRLAEAVHRSADTRYEVPVPVEGRDEVASLADAFNTAGARVRQHLVELQAREDGLRQFVANTAHDVGLPLTVLQGHLAELDAMPTSVRPEASALQVQGDARAAVRAAMQEAHYLGSLIRNLNAATRLDAVSTPLDTHMVDLNALVERVVSRHSVVARSREVELNHAVPEQPISTQAEVTLLEQAVGNLVDNAIRHNRAGGHVAIVLDRMDGNDRGFSITVTDDGPGVRDEDLARLTERWFRADDARTRRPDGQGLGLAIAAESIKRLGFTLTFERPADGGLSATIMQRST